MMLWFLYLLEHLIVASVVAAFITIYQKHGVNGVLRALVKCLRVLPGVDDLLHSILSGEVQKFTRKVKGQDNTSSTGKPPLVSLPEKGIPAEEILEEMNKLKEGELNAEDGRMFAYVYTGDSSSFELQKKAFKMFTDKTGLSLEHDELISQFYQAFMHENALNPAIFPALRKFENEAVSMTAHMLNGDSETAGNVTSGGTESILMAMKAYRDRARALWPHITDPEMVAPITIHPAHEKAANYFGFRIVHVPVGKDFVPKVSDMENAITSNTIALLTSAPQYCHGILDPIEEIAEVAVRHNLPLHVDACFGGFMLPWVEKLGYPVPKFDFRVPGVTSMTADIHKYGFGTKGASVVLYRNAEYRKYQYFAYSLWPGGLMGSPSMAGTRPGGVLAAAWVALRIMGQDGYLKTAKTLMETTRKLIDGINSIPGLCTLGKPAMTCFAIASDDPEINIQAVADVIETKGWKPERNQYPDSLHCTIMPHHVAAADQLLQDLSEAAQSVKENKALAKKGTAAMYGMVASLPDKSIIDDFIVEFFSECYKL